MGYVCLDEYPPSGGIKEAPSSGLTFQEAFCPIPDGVTSIGISAFSGCTGLTSVKIPNSVTSIGQEAFGGCGKLTSITIPDGVTSIECYTFINCDGLKSITIPSSVTDIKGEAFIGCTRLAHVYYKGTAKQRKQISIDVDAGNDDLLNATWHYQS